MHRASMFHSRVPPNSTDFEVCATSALSVFCVEAEKVLLIPSSRIGYLIAMLSDHE